jgi:hypothetical protein
MLRWLKALFGIPEPAGPPQTIRVFALDEPTIAQDCVGVDGDAWRIDVAAPQTMQLFEVPQPNVEQCMLAYRAEMRTEDLQGRAFLEMWCRFPGLGEYFSKDLRHAVSGTTNWARYETPFYLKAGQRADLIKLNLAVEGAGVIWIRRVELLKTPLAS